ncbi:MAG: glucose-6-phosphate isomerase, partial [Pseudomonadales bacterium]
MPGTSDIIWQALATHQSKLAGTGLAELFTGDPDRARRYQLNTCGLTLDYSKNLITDETLNLFSQLIDANELPHRVQLMMLGDIVNTTENRRALHTLLRTRANQVPEQLADEAQKVQDTLDRMEAIADAISSGNWTGYNDTRIRSIIHIGIGGSYLGPRMVAEALTPYASTGITCHYVANVDGHHIDKVLKDLSPEETLVIIASKTFTTLETRVNADSVRQWL